MPLSRMCAPGIIKTATTSALYELDFAGGDTSTQLSSAGFTFARTGTAWGPTGISFATGVPRISTTDGLIIEGARTNLVLRSQEIDNTGFWHANAGATITANARNGPNGAAQADDLACPSSTAGVYSSDMAATPGTVYSLSGFFLKVSGTSNSLLFGEAGFSGGEHYADFNISTGSLTSGDAAFTTNRIMDAGGGWKRVWVSLPGAGGVTTGLEIMYAGGAMTFSAWGAQVEIGPFPSTPIVTAGTTVTRSAETCSASRNLTQGTIIVLARTPLGFPSSGTKQVLWQLDGGATTNRVTIQRDSTGLILGEVVSSGSTVASLSLGVVADNTSFAVGLSFSANNFVASLNGGPLISDTSGAMPSVTTERFGHDVAAGSEWYGSIMLIELYDQRLSDSAMQSRVNTLAGSPDVGTQAMESDTVLKTVAINTHLNYTDTVYYTNYTDIIKPRLLELGVRYIRDNPGDPGQTTIINRYIDLANNGIKTLMINTVASHHTYVKDLNSGATEVVDSVEPPNERDMTGAGWETTLQNFMTTMWSTYRGDQITQDMTILGPAFANSRDSAVGFAGVFPTAGNYMDFGNLHDYGGLYPEGPGGAGWNLSLAQSMGNYDTLSGGKVIWATEHGYKLSGAVVGHPHVTERASAKYLVRGIMFHIKSGAQRIYIYQLINEQEDFGILNDNGTPRQTFTAVKNLLAMFSDPGATFTTSKLNYSLSGTLTNIQELVFQKRNGNLYLVLWQGVNSCNGGETDGTAVDVEPTPRALTLSLGSTFATINQYEPTFGTAAIATSSNASSASLSVKDHILVVELIS